MVNLPEICKLQKGYSLTNKPRCPFNLSVCVLCKLPQSLCIPTVPVDPAVFVKCHCSRCCFHGHPASNANCLVASLTPPSLTVVDQSSGERLFPSLSLFLMHYPSLFRSLSLSLSSFLSLSFFNNVTACHNKTKKQSMDERKGRPDMGAESSRGEHGNRSPTGPPSASCQNSLVTTLPQPSFTKAVRATPMSNIPLFHIDTHIYILPVATPGIHKQRPDIA